MRENSSWELIGLWSISLTMATKWAAYVDDTVYYTRLCSSFAVRIWLQPIISDSSLQSRGKTEKTMLCYHGENVLRRPVVEKTGCGLRWSIECCSGATLRMPPYLTISRAAHWAQWILHGTVRAVSVLMVKLHELILAPVLIGFISPISVFNYNFTKYCQASAVCVIKVVCGISHLRSRRCECDST